MPAPFNVRRFYIFHYFLDFADFDAYLLGFGLVLVATFDLITFAFDTFDTFRTLRAFCTSLAFALVLSHSKSSSLAIWALSQRLVTCFTILKYPPCLSEKPGAISKTNFLKAAGL